MVCPPVHGYNTIALVSRLSPTQVDKHGMTILYHLHQYRPNAHYEIFHAKVGEGGINVYSPAKICSRNRDSSGIVIKHQENSRTVTYLCFRKYVLELF